MTTESKRLREEAKKFGMSVPTYTLATLMAIGWTAAEAYALAYYENASYSASQNAAIRDNIVNNPNFRDSIEIIRRKLSFTTPSVKTSGGELSYGEDGQLSKMEIATLLRQQIESLPDGKEKAQVVMQYATLFAMQKKEEEKDDDEKIIHVYLPLPCNICPKGAVYDNCSKRDAEIRDAMNTLSLHAEWKKYDAMKAKKPNKERPDDADVVSAIALIGEITETFLGKKE